ncbi:ovochymase-2-like [Sitodiplosis mosellana]|uniref:ovochymase-2-like n=1 Tax=Sitodiplosis mosellana TaxID=263140 RepID=UPI00244484E7|nr:ovochymase-2-like [Sitodiplosis mosellana]
MTIHSVISDYKLDKVDHNPSNGICSDSYVLCGLQNRKYPEKLAMVCGEKQIGDTATPPDENPWTVGVFFGPTFRNFLCSGALISNEHVLISAECAVHAVRARDQLHYKTQVRMGSNDINGINTVKRNIICIYRHENYAPLSSSHDFDIGILQLDAVVPFGYNIQPICLPQSPFVDYTGILAITIGLYDSSTPDLIFSRFASKSQQTHVPIWMNEQCAEVSNYTTKFTDNMICAGDYEKATRRPSLHGTFDHGQLAIAGNNGGMELVGIYSFGPKSTVGIPPVYTRVANFLPWIQSKLTNKCMCAPKESKQNKDLNKIEVPKKQTGMCLEPPANSSCNCACGLRENGKQIVDEVYTKSNQYPWAVGIYGVGYFQCSGSLISEKHVVISAKCAQHVIRNREKGSHVEVRLGHNAINTVKRGIVHIYRHENYNFRTSDYNIGILQLDAVVPFGYNIQPICLPKSSSVYTGKIATAAGWHDTESKSSLVSKSKLLQIQFPIWTNQKCAKLPDYANKFTENMICAGEYENGAHRDCNNDFRIEQMVVENEHGSMELVGIHTL